RLCGACALDVIATPRVTKCREAYAHQASVPFPVGAEGLPDIRVVGRRLVKQADLTARSAVHAYQQHQEGSDLVQSRVGKRLEPAIERIKLGRFLIDDVDDDRILVWVMKVEDRTAEIGELGDFVDGQAEVI